MHLAVPKHDVHVIILNCSDQCVHSIGWIHRPTYLELLHMNIVPIYIYIYIYCRLQTVFSTQLIILHFISQLKMYTKGKIVKTVKPRDVGRDLFCLSMEVTAWENGY